MDSGKAEKAVSCLGVGATEGFIIHPRRSKAHRYFDCITPTGDLELR